MVGWRAAHRRRRGVDDPYRPQVQERSHVLRCELVRRDQERVGARSADPRDQVQPPHRARAVEPVADLHPSGPRLVEEAREEREGPARVPAPGEPADRRGWAVHRHPVRAEGHDRLQAESELLRPEAEDGRRRVHLLHQCDVDGRRHGAREPRVHRLAALRRGECSEGQARDRGDVRRRLGGHESRLQLEPEEVEEPRAAESAPERGVRVRGPATADRRCRVQWPCQAVGEHPLAGLAGGGLAQSRRQASALQHREGEPHPRLVRVRAWRRRRAGRSSDDREATRSRRTR